MSHGVHRGQLKSGKGDDRENFINKLINLNKDISHSKKSVQVINSMGTLDAKGFRNIDSEGKIYFDGIVTFKSHD